MLLSGWRSMVGKAEMIDERGEIRRVDRDLGSGNSKQ